MAVGSSVTAPISGGHSGSSRWSRRRGCGRGRVATMGQDGDGQLRSLALLKGDARKRVAVGMEAHVVPDSVKKRGIRLDEGTHIRASPPRTYRTSMSIRSCTIAQLTKSLFGGQHGAARPYRAGSATKDNPSGFEWWSGKGPPYKITPGTRRHRRHRRRARTTDHAGHSGAAQAAQYRGMSRPAAISEASGPHADRLPDGDGGMRARRRSASCSRITGGACRSRNCASPAASRATAASRPTSYGRREGYGLDAVSSAARADEVLRGPFPVIVIWNVDHFLVVEGVSGNKVYLNDPATGPRSVSREEFGKGFTGVSLEFKPGRPSPRAARGRACSPSCVSRLRASMASSPSSPGSA